MLRKLFDVAATAFIFGGIAAGYMGYVTARNRQRHESRKPITVDNTRPNNDSFGIGWGYKADDIIMNQIDSADLILLKFQCGETLSIKDYLKCLKTTAMKLEYEYNGLGIAFRDENGLKILLNEFQETKLSDYPELVARPYLKQLSMMKIKDLSVQNQRSFSAFMYSQEAQQKKEPPAQMFNRVFSSMGILQRKITDLSEIDDNPPVKNDFQNKVFVRTTVARQLQR